MHDISKTAIILQTDQKMRAGKILLTGFALLALLLRSISSNAQALLPPNDPLGRIVTLYMNYDTVSGLYTVFGKPNFTTTGTQFVMSGSSQISIVLPASEPDSDLSITSLPGAGGVWSENSFVVPGIYAPASMPDSDFHSVNITGSSPVLWSAGVPKPLFRFSLGGGVCVPGVRLYINLTDPQSSDPSLNGSDFTNLIENVAVAGSQFATEYNLDTLGYYTNTGYNCLYPLAPLGAGLISFDASLQANCTGLISWTVSNEDAVHAYEILAADGPNKFDLLATISPQGNTHIYSYTDKQLKPGVNTYKLRIIFKDGHEEYSSMAQLANTCNVSHTANVYPSPAVDVVNFDLYTSATTSTDVVMVQLYDATSKLIAENKVTVNAGMAYTKFDVANLAAGTYVIKYHNQKRQYTGMAKFVKTGM
jgi:hypothetical protein